jgi:hypothetical protein
MMVPSLCRDYTTAVKGAIRRTETNAAQRSSVSMYRIAVLPTQRHEIAPSCYAERDNNVNTP